MITNIIRTIPVFFAFVCALAGCRQTVDVQFDSSVSDYTQVVREILENHPEGNITLRFGFHVSWFHDAVRRERVGECGNQRNIH